LTQADLSQVNLDGELLAGGTPSKELGMHLAMYRARPEVGAVIHVHPTCAIAYSTLVLEANLDCVPAYSAAFYMRAGRVPMIDYYPSGSADLHHAVTDLAPCHHAILLRQHGVIVGAGDMSQAMGVLEEIEQCCQIALLTDGKGAPLTEAQKASIDQKMVRTWTK
jgi:ribulose-5-phosphate 4-epimerase/fuculose-1-phosphate aldolase